MNVSNPFPSSMRSNLKSGKWVLIVGLLGLASCQYFPVSEFPDHTKDTKTYQGRIAFKSPKQSFVTIFRWQESRSQFQLTLRDRLALRGVVLRGNDKQAQVEYSDGELVENVKLDEWIEDYLGITVPFKELWDCLSLKCRLIDEAAQQQYDQHGRLLSFISNSWAFTFSYRDPDPDSSTLHKLVLHKEDTKVQIFFTKFEH